MKKFSLMLAVISLLLFGTATLAHAKKHVFQPDIFQQLEILQPETNFQRGIYYYERGQYEQAIQCYDMVILFDPGSAAYNNRGNAYAALGRYSSAIQDYNDALRLNPNNAAAYYNRGSTYGDLGQYEQAIRDYNAALQLKPNYSMAYNNRGVAYRNLGLNDLATADFEKALEIDPNNTTARNNLGRRSSPFDGTINDLLSGIKITVDPKK